MGLFKKIKKAVSKVTKSAVGLVGLAPDVKAPSAAAEATSPAPVIEAPVEKATEDEKAQTESDKKKAQSGGKKSLSVSRSSGTGVNI